jgi:hypothetical protein
MSRAWKKVAMYADKKAFDVAEIRQAIEAAIASDSAAMGGGLPARIAEILVSQQIALFPTDRIEHLESLRPLTADCPMAQVLIEYAEQVAATGQLGGEAFIDAAAAMMESWAMRRSRQVEEHYFRKSSVQNGRRIRERLEAGSRAASFRRLAAGLLANGDSPKAWTIHKQTGLDEGVQI